MRKKYEIGNFYVKDQDAATLAKIGIFKKYFGIYFKLIDLIRKNPKNNSQNRKIKYIDLFSGPGVFFVDGIKKQSTPLIVLENIYANKYKNISFYFNDIKELAVSNLKTEIFTRYDDTFDCSFQSVDARDIDLDSIISKEDIVISLIDSFSYLCLDKNTIYKLTENYYSDVVCYFRVSNILEHIGNTPEKNNHIEILGCIENYNTLYKMCKSNVPQIEKVNFLIKSWIDNLNSIGSEKYFLPVFINFSGENTKIESVVFVISKNKLGLTKVLSMINDVENCDGRLFSYIGADINRTTIFDYETEFIEKVINEKEGYINRNELIDRLNDKFIENFGYISAYTESFINGKLKILEENDMLDILYLGNTKRKKYTYSDKTRFKLK